MKKRSKIVYKEFGSSFGRFMAIAGIIALGVAFLIGLTVSTPDIKKSFTEYFIQSNLADFSLRSESAFSEEDLERINGVDEVEDVLPLFSYDVTCEVKGKEYNVRFYATDEAPNINKLTLESGEMLDYETASQVVAITPFASMEVPELGDKLVVTEDSRNLTVEMFGREFSVPLFDTYEFEIMGTATSPSYYSFFDETCLIGDGKVDYILFADLSAIADIPTIGKMTTEVWVTAEDTAKYTALTQDYDKYIRGVEEDLNDAGDWYVLNRKTNLSYYSLSMNADKVANVATVFPIFFIAVAALVAFSTIVRMVDEDRSQIGTLRSLGYSGSAIASKYIFYGLSACILGLLLAVPLGLTILPIVIWNAYGSMYTLPAFHFTADFAMIGICSAVSIVATLLVTIIACASSLKETPASILQPRAPKPGKRILLERLPFWGLLPFKHKASLRNVFRFKRNFLMTVLAVAGCGALIIAGMGMLNSVAAVTDLQFNEIYSYDLTIGVSSDYAESAELSEFLSDKKYMEVRKERGSIIVVNLN
ncbi:MAG: ABC transporter permease [Clostridia bacterium]|nr:ABC transporter permease [Clostridia bacterium]